MRRLARIVVLGLVVGLFPRPGSAGIIDLGVLTSSAAVLSQSFVNDNDVAVLRFRVDGLTNFTAETTSYAGGLGFDPVLALFDEAGVIVQYEDAAEAGVSFFAVNDDIDLDGGVFDSRLAFALTGGDYTLALMQSGNLFTNDRLGSFVHDDDPTYTTTGMDPAPGCSSFYTFGGECRSGAFAFSVDLVAVNPPPAPVPEPATLTLFGIGAAGAALRRTLRRRRTPSTH